MNATDANLRIGIMELKVGETNRLVFPKPENGFTVDSSQNGVVEVVANSAGDPAWVAITGKQLGETLVTVRSDKDAQPLWKEFVRVRA
jgi:hypothetical protein